MKTGIICAQGLEECEGLIVYDLLYRAGIEVELIGLEKEITSSHKLTFTTDKTIDEMNPNEYECLVLPGGMPGTKNLEASKIVNEMIDSFVKENKIVAAICAAPGILVRKGLLNDNEFTCFPGHESNKISTKEKVCIHGNFITARGMGVTIEFAAAIIEKLCGEEKAQEILQKIQY